MSDEAGPVVQVQRDGNSTVVHSSRYILQTRSEKGYIITLGTYDREVRPEEVVQQFGPRSYTLKKVSPRFAVVWKHASTETKPMTHDLATFSRELDRLKKRTKVNSYAIVGLGIVTGAGFALSHMRFSHSEVRIGQLESVAKTISARHLHCPGCGYALDFMLQRFCASCGIQLNWPVDQISTQPSSLGDCQCGHPKVAEQKFCPNCGRADLPRLQFVPVSVDGA